MTGKSILGEDFELIFDTDKGEELAGNPLPIPTDFHIPSVRGLEWREYQEKAINDCWKAFQGGYHRIYYKMSVAGGKTFTSAALADNWLREGKSVLWLAHNRKLLKQAKSTFARLGWHPLHEQGGQEALEEFIRGTSKLVIGSVASLRGDRLRAWPKDSFSLIVYDECDMALAPKNVEIIRHFGRARLLGMTGTDDRGDGKNLGSLFQLKIRSLNLAETTKMLMTVPIVRNKIKVEPGIDLRKLKKRQGDFQEGELDRIIISESELICSVIAQERYKPGGIGDRPTMVFCPGIQSSEVIAENLTKFGIKAMALHSKMSDHEREIGERKFISGEYQCLVNAVAYTVGTDFPFVSCVVLLRPTKVRRLLEQIIGRGVRLPDDNPLSAGKKDCLVIDFPWIVGDVHKLVHTVDIYDDGSLAGPVKERAKQIMDEKSCSPQEAIERAKQDYEIAQNRWEYANFTRREVMVKSLAQDPLSMFGSVGLKEQTLEERAKEILDEKSCSPQEAIERAEREKEITEHRREYAEFRKREVVVKSMMHDPLSMFGIFGLKEQTPAESHMKWRPPDHETLQELIKFRVPNPEKLSYDQAIRLLRNHKNRRNKGLCSGPQARYLLSLGASPDSIKTMRFIEAADAIEQLKEARGY